MKGFSLNTNDLIRNFMGFIYHEVADIDYSECGGIYSREKIYSKTPIPIEKYPAEDQYYLKEDWEAEVGSVLYGDLKYHSSWEWLMPVIEKIESLGYRTTMSYRKGGEGMFYEMIICDRQFDYDTIVAETFAPGIGESERIAISWVNTAERKTKIQCAYRAVVNFIKYYNQINLVKELKQHDGR